MRLVKYRSIALILLGFVGIGCTVPDAVFIEDTVIFLPFGKATDEPKDLPLEEAGAAASNPDAAIETGH